MNQNRLGRRGGIKNVGQWRQGHVGPNQNNRQQHSEHDDRKPGVTELKRRVTFKNAGGRGGRGGVGIRLSDVRVRQQLEADQEMAGDVEISLQGKAGGQTGRFRGGRGMRGRRSGSPPPRMMGFQVRKRKKVKRLIHHTNSSFRDAKNYKRAHLVGFKSQSHMEVNMIRPL